MTSFILLRCALALALIGMPLASACGGGASDAPTPLPTLCALTIEASASCTVGGSGIPYASYQVVMQDKRSTGTWRFVENREAGGPRDEVMTLSLEGAGASMTGSLQGPAIIQTPGGRVTVVARPLGVALTAANTGSEVVGTWSGALIAGFLDSGQPFATCQASDHRFRLALPPSRS